MSPFRLNQSLLISLLLVLVPLFVSVSFLTLRPKVTAMASIEVFGVKIEKNPPKSKLTELGVTAWPKWGCAPSKFPWTFTATETMYLLEGKVKVNVDGYDGSFEIGAADLVVFPKGMKVTWDVTEAVNKHYSLEK
ncbi:RmlC-like cupins superfamily protein [Quillaja saponaria]|uniref:RmlC-like cupins superfamily protein n=1 Tax=Quillaja saponaria TaxID=32244 RepID=A0AAD7Q664_QUISA|nr:RmlC-like cupins superfamily protein [Quillaja saponaria]